MTEVEYLNKALLYLHSKKDADFILPEALNKFFNTEISSSLAYRMLEKLHQDGLIIKHQTGCALSHEGVELFDSLPDTMNELPYEMYIINQRIEKDKKFSKQSHEGSTRSSIMETNYLIRKTSVWNTRLYYATMIIAIGTLATPLTYLINDREKGNLNLMVKQLQKTNVEQERKIHFLDSIINIKKH